MSTEAGKMWLCLPRNVQFAKSLASGTRLERDWEKPWIPGSSVTSCLFRNRRTHGSPSVPGEVSIQDVARAP